MPPSDPNLLDDFRQGEPGVALLKAELYTMNISDRFDPVDEK